MNAVLERAGASEVVKASRIDHDALCALLSRYGLNFVCVAPHEEIPGSYWGECEAGLIGEAVHWRADTPVHSILHEACHVICMDGERRRALDRDAGGDFDEENAVCYLQILLSDELAGVGRLSMWHDMDAWGYTFRLGSAQAWFEQDAEDARRWLIDHGLTDEAGRITWRMRDEILRAAGAHPAVDARPRRPL